jgi:hypothetical protein
MSWSTFAKRMQASVQRAPIVVTKRGKPAFVCLGLPTDKTRLGEAKAMIALLAMGELDIMAGRTIPHRQVIRDMRARLKRRLAAHGRQPKKPRSTKG